MTQSLYQVFARFLSIALHFHAIFSQKSRKGIKGRKAQGLPRPKQGKRAWVHCASLGEFEQGKALIESLKKNGIEVVISFFSPSGYEQVKTYEHADWISYLPFDTKKRVSKFINKVDADIAIFIKYEFWWNYLTELQDRKIPTYFVSVVLRKEHYIFRSWAGSFLSILKQVQGIYLIDQVSYELLSNHSFQNIHQSSDTRAESVLKRMNEEVKLELIEDFVAGHETIVFASVYSLEMDHLPKIADDLVGNYKLLIFPHEINHRELGLLKEQLGKQCMLYSEIESQALFTGYNILIVDVIGLLKDTYRYADIAYVGGGLTGGLHNTLEPFVYKLPLVFGPSFQKFPEARILAKQDFTVVIQNFTEITSAISTLQSREFATDIEKVYSLIFEQEESASARILADIKKELWSEVE